MLSFSTFVVVIVRTVDGGKNRGIDNAYITYKTLSGFGTLLHTVLVRPQDMEYCFCEYVSLPSRMHTWRHVYALLPSIGPSNIVSSNRHGSSDDFWYFDLDQFGNGLAPIVESVQHVVESGLQDCNRDVVDLHVDHGSC